MSGIVKVIARVKLDSTGHLVELPVLLTHSGVFVPLLDYVISKSNINSFPWMNRVVLSCQLLLEYMEANKDLFSTPTKLFESFVLRLSSGTIGLNGDDPSELYWLPRSASNVNQLLSSLNGLTDWLSTQNKTTSMNPFEEASSHQQRLNYAAWHKKNKYNFLGHIKNNALPEMIKKVRKIRGKKDVFKVDDNAISFPEHLFKHFFVDGIGSSRDPRVALRDQLILLLMHGAGVRESEALHLWVHDVFIDPDRQSCAIVKLFHPEYGKAPNNWSGRKRQSTRSAYLAEKYALTPRNRLAGTARVGWKSKLVDSRDNYLHLFWFPSFYGELFLYLWQQYLLYLLPLDLKHPYAFVSFSKKTIGSSLTLNAYNQSYKASMARINLSVSKPEGRSPHAHRHAYGRRLSSSKVDPLIIKKALHHSSLNSQVVYTQPGIKDVTIALEEAARTLNSMNYSNQNTDDEQSWSSIMERGFEDIDPDALFSGKYPKLRR